jgi:hypothetical protein
VRCYEPDRKDKKSKKSKRDDDAPPMAMTAATLAAVGGCVHALNPVVDPQLETARCRPLSLPLDPSRKPGYEKRLPVLRAFAFTSSLCFLTKRNLCRYAAAAGIMPTTMNSNQMGGGFGMVGGMVRVGYLSSRYFAVKHQLM